MWIASRTPAFRSRYHYVVLGFVGGESADKLAEISPTTMQKQVSEFLATRFSVLRHMRDEMADSQDKQEKTS